MTRVTGIGVEEKRGRRRVTHVETDRGRIACDVVVNAGGMFAYEIGRMAGVNVPIIPMAHQYALTRPAQAMPKDLPTMRDPDRLVYFREEVGGLVVGGYERNPDPWCVDGAIPPEFNNTLLPPDWDRFLPLTEAATTLVPCLADAEVTQLINGPEAFTPDGEFILGESDVSGFFVAAGFCAHGIAGAGGNGQVMAEWIVGGEPPLDLWKMDIRRFGEQYRSRGYSLARTYEVYSTYYDIVYPNHEREAGRPLKVPPAYTRHVGLGADLGEKSGWERVNWYWSNADRDHEAQRPRGWAGQHWSTAIVTEHLACREAAALFDESSFAKIEVTGPGAAGFLQRLCANDVDKRPGAITYTSMLNSRGGIECDFTVTRLEEERFLIVTGTAFGRHDLSWIRSHLPTGDALGAAPVAVQDVTSSMACFALWGPRARDILSELERGRPRLPLHERPPADGRRRAVPGAAGDLRGRAGMGAVPTGRVRAAALGHGHGVRPAARPGAGRLPRHRLTPPGEGLPRLGLGHHQRDRPVLGRPGLRGAAGEGGLPGTRGRDRLRP